MDRVFCCLDKEKQKELAYLFLVCLHSYKCPWVNASEPTQVPGL